MREVVLALRVTGIVAGLLFVAWLAWVVLLGPAALLLLNPR